MAVDYQKKVALAGKLIRKFTPSGNNTVWKKAGKEVPDPAKPWETTFEDATEYSCRMVFIESRDRKTEFYFTDLLSGTNVPSDSTFALFHEQGFVPEIGDSASNTAGDEFRCNFKRKYAPEKDTLFWIVALK